jgi:hypothetical protein
MLLVLKSVARKRHKHNASIFRVDPVGLKNELAERFVHKSCTMRWRKHVPPKYWLSYRPTRLHGAITEKTTTCVLLLYY